MPKQTLVIGHQEHADIMAAVGGQNGLNVTSVGVYLNGELVAYDEVRLEVDGIALTVRSAPEDSPSEIYRKRLETQMWGILNGDLPQESGHHISVQEVGNEEPA